jgi:anti-sigma-K factor RskA
MTMTAHEQFADDLALLALGALQGDELRALEEHLAGCAACRGELDLFRGDMALLALSASGPQPPQWSRQRLMAAIAKEPRRAADAKRRGLWSLAQLIAAFAMVVLAVGLLRQNAQLQQQVAELQQNSARQQDQLQKAKMVLETLTAPDAAHFTLVAGKPSPQPEGKAVYLRDKGSLVFMASNMPALPSHKAYELWLIPMSGSPIPAGMFKPDAKGSGVIVYPPLPGGVEAKAFAVTMEPELGSSVPTSPLIIMGAGG